MIDSTALKKNFPALLQKIHGRDLVYFDNAATTHKPQQVIDAITHFYSKEYATIYRGIYTLAERATERYEFVREQVAHFIGAHPQEIIFTRGATAGINFIATAWTREMLSEGDEIVLTELEHHANLIPWQQVAHKTHAVLKFIPVTQEGQLDFSSLSDIITHTTKLVATTWCSNAIGTQVDLEPIITRAHEVGAKVLVDGTQTAAHRRIKVHELGADFLVFSAHKMLGPTGLGVLYMRKKWFDEVPPYQFGGGMVFDASWDNATWRPAPQKYEAGTPPIAQVIGFGAALDYFANAIDFDELRQREAYLCRYLIDEFSRIDRIRILGPVDELKEDGHLVSFVIDGVHPHDIAAYLDQYGICVRAGNHCARPLHVKLGLDTSVRASFYLYNSPSEVEYFIQKIKELLRFS